MKDSCGTGQDEESGQRCGLLRVVDEMGRQRREQALVWKPGGWSRRQGVRGCLDGLWLLGRKICPVCYSRTRPLKTKLICGRQRSLVTDRHTKIGRRAGVPLVTQDVSIAWSALIFTPNRQKRERIQIRDSIYWTAQLSSSTVLGCPACRWVLPAPLASINKAMGLPELCDLLL